MISPFLDPIEDYWSELKIVSGEIHQKWEPSSPPQVIEEYSEAKNRQGWLKFTESEKLV